jgi:hypothetical protein
MVRGKGADHVFCRADSSRVRTQGDHSLSFNRLVDGLSIHQKLVPILFGFKPEGITGCPGPYTKPLASAARPRAAQLVKDFPASNTPAEM